MTDPIVESDAWRRGTAAALQQTADIDATVDVPVSRTSAAMSILASPHIRNWPVECREWLLDKCPSILDPLPPIAELDPAKHWTDWAAALKEMS